MSRNTYIFLLSIQHYIHFTHPLVLHNYPIHVYSQLLSILTASISFPLPDLVVPPDEIFWWSFDLALHCFGIQLISWSGDIVQHYMLETSALYFRTTSYFYFRFSIYFTTFPHVFITFIVSIIIVPIYLLAFLLSCH